MEIQFIKQIKELLLWLKVAGPRLLSTALTKLGFPSGSVVKNPPANAGDTFNLWVRKIPWRRKWQPTPVFLPGEFHGQRNLVGYSPRGREESDMTF